MGGTLHIKGRVLASVLVIGLCLWARCPKAVRWTHISHSQLKSSTLLSFCWSKVLSPKLPTGIEPRTKGNQARLSALEKEIKVNKDCFKFVIIKAGDLGPVVQCLPR